MVPGRVNNAFKSSFRGRILSPTMRRLCAPDSPLHVFSPLLASSSLLKKVLLIELNAFVAKEGSEAGKRVIIHSKNTTHEPRKRATALGRSLVAL